MFRTHSSLLIVAVFFFIASGVLFAGCDDNGDEKPRPFVNEEDLWGSWRISDSGATDTFEFGEDRTAVRFLESEFGTKRFDGTWLIGDDARLSWDLERSYADGSATITEKRSRASFPAIIENRLYQGVLYRDRVSTEELDGRWSSDEIEEQHLITEEGSSSADDFLAEQVFTDITITGEEIDYRRDVTSEDEETRYYTTTRGNGTIRIDGTRIYFTLTTIDGDPVPETSQEEEFLGHRLHNQIIDITTDEGGDPVENSYERQ